ncbi:MAG TPA: aminodeoxychorismate synthase component I [Xanthomonadales bacterium]|nr:aminodeoxychorismate synthase component I [Xanthomonadales bacterium]
MPASHYQWLDRVPDLVSLSAASPQSFPFLLDNAAGPGCSLLFYASDEKLVQDSSGAISGPGEGNNFFERLDLWFQDEKTPAGNSIPGTPEMPFSGGWFLYLGYEMVAAIEPKLQLPVNATGLPDALAVRCPGAVLVFEMPGDSVQSKHRTALAVAESPEVLQRITELLARDPGPSAEPIPKLLELHEDPPAHFEAGVSTVLEYLAAGDVFQVNISRPWMGRFAAPPDPSVLYNSLRTRNPAPFAGMLRWQDMVLLSSSPERLVEVRGQQVQTRPIAGTRPRGKSPEQDEALARELIDNPKEQAEHVMLIDLERNDLGRVCEPGSVEVNEFMVVESYAHVHHIVSNVRGRLRADAGPVQAIQAVFPGGTITGCPKVRCMEIIAEFEQQGRGFYTGSMGYLGRSGELDLNILIRSMLLHDDRVYFRTGAGIVADSVPAQELQETADKARGLLLSLHAETMAATHA